MYVVTKGLVPDMRVSVAAVARLLKSDSFALIKVERLVMALSVLLLPFRV